MEGGHVTEANFAVAWAINQIRARKRKNEEHYLIFVLLVREKI